MSRHSFDDEDLHCYNKGHITGFVKGTCVGVDQREGYDGRRALIETEIQVHEHRHEDNS